MSNHGEIRDFEKDFGKVKPLQGSGALGLIGGVLGGAAKTIGKIGGAFANTAKQYLNIGKGNKPFWPTTRNTGDLYANARKRAELSQQTPRKGFFKPFHRSGKVYDKDMINKEFSDFAKRNVKKNYNTQPTLTEAQKKAFSQSQSEYLKQQMAAREVGSASSRLQKTHQNIIKDFYKK